MIISESGVFGMIDKIQNWFDERAARLDAMTGFNWYLEFTNDYKMVIEVWVSDCVIYKRQFTDIKKMMDFVDSKLAHALMWEAFGL